MQAFIWYHLVPVENWNVVVSGKPGAKMPLQIVMPSPRITLPRGGDLRLSVLPLAKNIAVDQLHVQLSDPPEGITASIISRSSGAFAIEIEHVRRRGPARLAREPADQRLQGVHAGADGGRSCPPNTSHRLRFLAGDSL